MSRKDGELWYSDNSQFERRSDEWTIRFRKNQTVDFGSAVIFATEFAAVIFVSPSTAKVMRAADDDAIHAVLDLRRPVHLAVHLALPCGRGCDYSEERQSTDIDSTLAAEADALLTRTAAEVVKQEAKGGGYASGYRWYQKVQRPKLLWLSDLRESLCDEIPLQWTEANRRPTDLGTLSTVIRGGRVLVVNERGARIGKYHAAENLLTLRYEHARPAAEVALLAIGHTPKSLPQDLVPEDYADACLEIGSSTWPITWPGEVLGIPAEVEIGQYHPASSTLVAYAKQFVYPVKSLLARHGLSVATTRTLAHALDPNYLFGLDPIGGLERADRHRPRRLTEQMRSMIPFEHVARIEEVWNPPALAGLSDGVLEQKGWSESFGYQVVAEESDSAAACRLCGLPSGNQNTRYCQWCRDDARFGLFQDRGLDESWMSSTRWALAQLAIEEFDGPPAKAQLDSEPSNRSPEADRLMIYRMLIPRSDDQALRPVRKIYSWSEWLQEAGLLSDGLRTSRGTVTVAKDGHLCRSLLERHIDDFFHTHGIAHLPEPHYPYDPILNTSGFRADWRLIDGTFVEALGFPKDPKYMAKVQRKLALASGHGIHVVTVTSEQLNGLPTIFEKWVNA